jgi:prepilin-type N-terminal cleavage/methylation domain-containing protein
MEARSCRAKYLSSHRHNHYSGFTLLEMATSMAILAVLAAVVVPLATSLMDGTRASTAEDDLSKIYTAIVGNPAQNTYGYLGDVGCYPASVLDLVQQPTAVPTGCSSTLANLQSYWNGPYITNARIDNNVVYDAFGGPIEYYQVTTTAGSSSVTDQLVLISRGPDRNSTNTATQNGGTGNPNVASSFVTPAPSSVSYGNGTYSANNDNVVYPHAVDNQQLAYYQSVGTLNINISDYDDAVGAVMPACPNNYNIAVVSVPRNANEAYAQFNPGGASFDLLQGLYLVKVYVGSSSTPIWQEQVSIVPNTLTTRNVTLPGVNSSQGTALALLTISNASGNTYTIYQGSVNKGSGSGNITLSNAITPCSRILVANSSNQIVDSFVAPATTGYTRRFNLSTTKVCPINFSNGSANKTISVYENGALLGTVTKRGSRALKSLYPQGGSTLTFFNESNTQVNGDGAQTYSVPVNSTCPATPPWVQF